MADSLIKSLPNVTALTQSPSMIDLVLLEQYQSGGDPNVPNNNTYAASSMYLRDFLNSVFQAKGAAGRNRLINGDMRVDQRNAGASLTPTTDGQYTVDRWSVRLSQASKFSVQQKQDATFQALGFSYYALITSLSAYSIGSSDFFAFSQVIEGLNIDDLGFGQSAAKAVSLSFCVASSLAGNFTGSLRNVNATFSFPFSFNIPVANTPTKITITIPGDTAHTLLASNAASLILYLCLGAGSTNLAPTGSWQSGTFFGASGVSGVNLVATNAATLSITGIQFEAAPFDATAANPIATPFERLNYADQLFRCQRYYEVFNFVQNIESIALMCESTSTAFGGFFFKVTKRAAPTMSLVSGSFAVASTSAFVAGTLGFRGTTPELTGIGMTAVAGSPLVNGNASVLAATGAAALIVAAAEL